MTEDSPHRLGPPKPPLESLTRERFEFCVLDSELPAAVFVTSNRRRICVLAEKELRLAIPDFADQIVFFRVDAEVEKDLVIRLDVLSAPSLLIFTSGVEVKALLGFHSADELHTQLWSIISTGEEL